MDLSYDIKKELNTQDNLYTQHPLFVVFQKREMVVPQTHDNDGYKYFNSDACESYTEEEVKKELEFAKTIFTEEDFEDIAKREGFEKYYYKKYDVFCTACFTRKGAEDYLARNQHNLTKPYIYVETLYRNHEMIEIREHFMKSKEI